VARRSLAGLVLAACAGHLVMVLSGVQSPLLTAAFLAMAVVCAPCAIRLWECDSSRTLGFLALMAGAMLVAHLVIVLTPSAMPGMPRWDRPDDLVMLATTGIEALVLLGVLGLALVGRGRRTARRRRAA
jgi:hypothetical protein